MQPLNFASKLHEVIVTFASVMKFFSLILSIYILALSLVPCTDGVVNEVCGSEKIELSDSGHSHEHSNHSDDCTPFCTCTCCGSIVTIPPSQYFWSPTIIVCSSYLFPYSLNYSFDYVEGTWHPPAFC